MVNYPLFSEIINYKIKRFLKKYLIKLNKLLLIYYLVLLTLSVHNYLINLKLSYLIQFKE